MWPVKRIVVGISVLLVGIFAGHYFSEHLSDTGRRGSDRGAIESVSHSVQDGSYEKQNAEMGVSVALQLGLPSKPLLIGPNAGPVAKSFNRLIDLARRGNAEAACTLAVDLNRCRNRANSLAAATRIRNAMAAGNTSTDDRAVSTVATILNSATALDEICSEVSPEMLDQAYAMQRLAARKSEAQARWLATNPLLDRGDVVRDLDRWTDYQRFAARYFADVVVKKNSEDLVSLLLVHYPGETSLPRPPYSKPDPERFLALFNAALSAGIRIPPEITDRANQLTMEKIEPRPLSLSHGWKGKTPQSVDTAIRDSMFPLESKQFCGSE